MLRLIILIILFLASLLCIFKAPEFYLWYLQILVTEFSWIFISIIIFIICIDINNKRFIIPALLLSLISIIIFSFPLLKAYQISKTLNSKLETSFKIKHNVHNNDPFHLINIFGIKSEKKVISQSIIYDSVKNLSFDYYKTCTDKFSPSIIVVHGGSWSGGDSKQLHELNSHLALAGYNVVSINYRLAPKFLSPAPIEDIVKAITFLKRNSFKLKIDTNNLVLLGRSAGAQIVLAAAANISDPSIKGVISFYGPADMIWGYQHPASKLIMDSKKVMEDYLGGTLQQLPEKYKESSPIELLNNYQIPTLLIHGENDPLVAYEHSKRYNKRLDATKAPHFLLTLPWATHGCDYTLNGPSGQLSTYSVDFFLKKVFY